MLNFKRKNHSGATLTEYTVIMSFLIAVAFIALPELANNSTTTLKTASDALDGVIPQGPEGGTGGSGGGDGGGGGGTGGGGDPTVSGGGGGCLTAKMSIIMADGSTKPVQDIRVGDLVTSWDDKSKTVTTGKVIAFQSKLAPEYYILNDKIEATPTHPFMVNGKWTAVAAIEPGDVIRSVDGKNIKITSKKHIKKEVAIFNFTVEKFHNYYVEGLLSHNFGFINIGFFARNFVKSP